MDEGSCSADSCNEMRVEIVLSEQRARLYVVEQVSMWGRGQRAGSKLSNVSSAARVLFRDDDVSWVQRGRVDALVSC
jgi:hypothetical protein